MEAMLTACALKNGGEAGEGALLSHLPMRLCSGLVRNPFLSPNGNHSH